MNRMSNVLILAVAGIVAILLMVWMYSWSQLSQLYSILIMIEVTSTYGLCRVDSIFNAITDVDHRKAIQSSSAWIAFSVIPGLLLIGIFYTTKAILSGSILITTVISILMCTAWIIVSVICLIAMYQEWFMGVWRKKP
jgi:hypothetical protein